MRIRMIKRENKTTSLSMSFINGNDSFIINGENLVSIF